MPPDDDAPAAPPPLAFWGTADRVFDCLEGAWTLDRRIGAKATMTGLATLARVRPGLLKYREDGRVRLEDGKEFDGHREYFYERSPAGFMVLFAEEPMRLFHDIAVARTGDTLVGAATHLCIADNYDSRYVFHADGTFTVEHAVSGPHKDYVSRTVFTRRAG